MMEYLKLLVGTIVLSYGIYFVSYKIFNVKIKMLKLYNLGVVLLYAVTISILSTIAYNSIIRVFCNVLLIGVMNQLIFKQEILKTIIGSFIVFGIISMSEILWVIILSVLSHLDMEQIKNHYFLDLITNTGIAIIMILIIHIKNLSKKINILIERMYLKRKINIIIWTMCSILCLLLLFYYIYYEHTQLDSLLICIFLIGCYTCLPLILFKEKSEKFKLQVEYDATLKNLNDYEQMLDLQRMKNHENNNHLSVIRGMIDSKNKEAIEFIDSLTEKAKNDNTDIVFKTKNIPSGGLQGLIYQKVLFMEQKKYHYNLEVSKEIKKLKLKKMKTEDVKDMCTVVGVLLDNAIQAVQGYRKKLVGIYLYKEKDNLVITISNNFKGNLELEKFEERGYTTKSTGHGYGLSLVKEIIDRNPNITNEKSFHGEVFSQILKVKMS